MLFQRNLAIAVILFTVPASGTSVGAGAAGAAGGTRPEALRATARLDEVRRERDAYEAERLVGRAVREEQRGQDAEAEALYARAAGLDPANERARQGLRATRERLGLVVEPSPLLERAGREMRLKRQELTYRFDASLEAARRGIATGRADGFAAARVHIERAGQIRASAAGVVSAEEADAMDARVRERELDLSAANRATADAARDARERDRARRIKEARLHDKRL